MRTISETQSARADRDALARQLLDELAAVPRPDWLHRLRRWPGGAISVVHLHLLFVLKAEGPMSMTRVAEGLGVSMAGATGVVDRMERRGLVERRHTTEDRRIVNVHLTEGGGAILTALDVDRRLRLARLVTELTDQELAGFLAGVRGLRAARARLDAADDAGGDAAGTREDDA